MSSRATSRLNEKRIIRFLRITIGVDAIVDSRRYEPVKTIKAQLSKERSRQVKKEKNLSEAQEDMSDCWRR
ncbi:hypothetical protein PGT21_004813 [Puccinia graminis f. sp. tritici]|uniref:Uncharacterized protein n=1 Tax=Puccinia graminis f. sp. tritici TaxID=56615 RepID=A0A5B0PHC3_PUCGR|nr:hypothetical protein PGT21_004813 [Puccinia graminis f. sp. tritici]